MASAAYVLSDLAISLIHLVRKLFLGLKKNVLLLILSSFSAVRSHSYGSFFKTYYEFFNFSYLSLCNYDYSLDLFSRVFSAEILWVR